METFWLHGSKWLYASYYKTLSIVSLASICSSSHLFPFLAEFFVFYVENRQSSLQGKVWNPHCLEQAMTKRTLQRKYALKHQMANVSTSFHFKIIFKFLSCNLHISIYLVIATGLLVFCLLVVLIAQYLCLCFFVFVF